LAAAPPFFAIDCDNVCLWHEADIAADKPSRQLLTLGGHCRPLLGAIGFRTPGKNLCAFDLTSKAKAPAEADALRVG